MKKYFLVLITVFLISCTEHIDNSTGIVIESCQNLKHNNFCVYMFWVDGNQISLKDTCGKFKVNDTLYLKTK